MFTSAYIKNADTSYQLKSNDLSSHLPIILGLGLNNDPTIPPTILGYCFITVLVISKVSVSTTLMITLTKLVKL